GVSLPQRRTKEAAHSGRAERWSYACAMSAVRESFQRARRGDFARLFYDDLLAADPAIKRSFARTDFDAQRALLIHGIYSMLDYYEGKEIGKMAISRLAGTHGPRALNVTPAMYDQWLRSFQHAMALTDPEWSEQLASAWDTALQPAIERLKLPYREHHQARAPH